MGIKHTVKNKKEFAFGKGIVSPLRCRHLGKGFFDSLIPTAINFATNTNSAINTGQVAADVFNTVKVLKGVKNNIDEAMKHEQDRIRTEKLLKDIKKGSGFRKI